jgi:hypothetical protein
MVRKLKQQVVIHPAEFSTGVAPFSSNDDFTIAFLTHAFAKIACWTSTT